MKKVSISKEFVFEAAHALDNHEGKCKNLHGHSYKLTITIEGIPVSDNSKPDAGMVIDFSVLKKIVKDQVIDVWDHSLILKADSRFKGIEKQNSKTIYVPYHPTCENMLLDVVERVSIKLPSHVKLIYAKLNETATSYSEWRD